MTSKFRADLDKAQSRQAEGKLPFASLTLDNIEDGAAVEVVFQMKGQQCKALIRYFSLDDYPWTAAAFISSEDSLISADLARWTEDRYLEGRLEDVLKEFSKFVNQGADDDNIGSDPCDMDDDDDSDASDGDDQLDMAEAVKKDELEEIYTKSSRWEALEVRRVAVEKEEEAQMDSGKPSTSAAAWSSGDEKRAMENQLFDKGAAFVMLSNELKNIMGASDSPIRVDTVEDDVYHLVISLHNINPSSPLGEDLIQLTKRYGYGEIDLDVRLKRGLHPFYPASIQILRPRFIGPIAAAVASHPMLRLKHWDPWRSLTELSLQIQCFLERAARVDLESPLCDAIRYSHAYLPVERLLAQLEFLTDTEPACLPEEAALYSARDTGVDAARMEALEPISKRAKTPSSTPSKVVWAAGTGYGTHGTSCTTVWDKRQSDAVQDAQDAEMESIIQELTDALEPVIRSREKHKIGAGEPFETTVAVKALESSCLIPYLRNLLTISSFTDMCARTAFYTSIVNLVGLLAVPSLAHLIVRRVPPEGSNPPLLEVLESLRTSAGHFLHILASVKEEAAAPKGQASSKEEANRKAVEDRQRSKTLASLLGDVTNKARALLPTGPTTRQSGPAPASKSSDSRWFLKRSKTSSAGASTSASTDAVCDDQLYVQTLANLRLEPQPNLSAHHYFKNNATAETTQFLPRTLRVAKEISGLGKDLPLNPQSSVFVRFDEQNSNLWKALIVGPEGTPYEGGLFEFDFYFPSRYPEVPPQVQFLTTGGGSVRMNPNLYDSGKVCLSLLGTWSGGKGEGWVASTSTALQVLVSIQSLILVDMPFYNEPGYEARTDSTTLAVKYNANIRQYTMQNAMVGQLKQPPFGFEEVVKAHFRLRGRKILATCERWAMEAATGQHVLPNGTLVNLPPPTVPAPAQTIEKYISQIRELIYRAG